MTDKIDLAAMYAAALPQRTRENLLAQYCDYISLVRNLENVVRRYKPAQLAAYQINSLFSKEDENPWSVDKTDREERAAYDSFVANEPPAPDTHYCFVSLNRTSPRFAGEGPGIFSMPESFATYGVSHSLPARVERCVAAFRKEEKLKDAVFLVGGRWKMRYQNEHGDRLLSEAFEDEAVAKSYEAMMDLLTLLPEDKFEYEDRELLAVQTEAMASQLIAPFENVLLSSFAALSEESNEALKKILGKRAGSSFINRAESEGLIGSAAVLQDGMNIRHLMHHQWDTLDGMGKFNEWATVKNDSLRRRFLDSYARLCDKPISERLNAYADAAAGFTPLISALNPDFLVRGKNESNNKFMTRLKEYRRTRPEAGMIIEMAYPYGSDKKEALLKSISRQFPDARVIDRSDMDIDGFLERIAEYIYRKNYLEVFQQIEYRMSQFCLFSGKNIQTNAAVPYLRSRRLMSGKEAEQWAEYRQLRNDLSHKYLDAALMKRLKQALPDFLKLAFAMDDRITAASPVVRHLHDNIYQAVHADGRVVEIDYENRRILGMKNLFDSSEKAVSPAEKSPTDKDKNKKAARPAPSSRPAKKKISSRPYIEEYPNGTGIGVCGTEITSCRLPNGVLINLRAGKMAYPDGSKFYFGMETHNSLTVKGGVRLITDKDFKVQNYILNGKSVNIAKNESAKFPNSHGFALDKHGYLQSEEFLSGGGQVVKMSFQKGGEVPQIRFSDGTVLRLSPEKPVLSHAGIELSYRSRKAFAESYFDGGNGGHGNSGNGGIFPPGGGRGGR